ncbi:MAG: Antidote-toxin recognition MazE, bacterial antitoxin [Rickettsiaceae bacterium]|jgi:antitoxin component of MazEF toxin-antitoxin module|nr:Antidote-toxin recognition MazE, bacterial antitoxin [Rickettsiaceae bacterium]
MTKAILNTHYLIKSELNSWGNSVGFRIPKKVLDLLGLKKGSKVSLTVKSNTLVIQKDVDDNSSNFWADVEKMDLEKMCKKINSKNRPNSKEFETKPVGKEVW